MNKCEALQEMLEKSKLTVNDLNETINKATMLIAVGEIAGIDMSKQRKNLENVIVAALMVLEGKRLYTPMDIKEEEKLDKLQGEIGYDKSDIIALLFEHIEKEYGEKEKD